MVPKVMYLVILFVIVTSKYSTPSQYPQRIILNFSPHQLPGWSKNSTDYLNTYLEAYSVLKISLNRLNPKAEAVICYPEFYADIRISDTQTFLNLVQRLEVPSVIITTLSTSSDILSLIQTYHKKLSNYQVALSFAQTQSGKCFGRANQSVADDLMKGLEQMSLDEEFNTFKGIAAVDYKDLLKYEATINVSTVFVNFFETSASDVENFLNVAKKFHIRKLAFDISEFANSMFYQNCGFIGNLLSACYEKGINVDFVVNRSAWLLSNNFNDFLNFVQISIHFVLFVLVIDYSME
ncbi:hypothetical protein EIN_132170 [Entamoeba invadens IP1]|uniref:Uncharacterized protein n=1 Tax=Entamoeba invadens IP1 TaxID=370355 RepID=A0A0A1UH03_ENTIV|nr:hypothetical protein EIN_132170 [Entamoeba invadens IP1]ELP94348.1 hypothetical protein EIN_132170 [Entamoeba invadens IP1]|eukprot:XP_004261119.1 hypothetical protein EIN_132170 [Entamoeba invadens IP1]